MNRTAYRLAAGTLFAGGIWLGLAALDSPAHADSPPPTATIERPGGPLDRAVKLPHRLPQQASARAKAAVAKATARPSAPAEQDEEPEGGSPEGGSQDPTPTHPTPAPTSGNDDQTPEPAPPADPPVELPPVELPPVLDPPPVVVEPAPVELPPVELPPVEVPLPPVEVPPLPAPPVEVPPPAPPTPLPTPPAEPAVVAPVALPAAADPIPAPPPAGTVVTQLIAGLTAGTDQPADCADSPDDARRIDRDALRHLLAGLDHEPPPTTAQKPAPGCPGTPDRGSPGGVQVKPPPPSAAEMVVAYLARSHVPPVLGRLEHARARSHLPASRHVAMEPGPA